MYGKYKVIALCMTRVESERNFQFIKALSEKASEKGYRIFIYQMISDMLWSVEPERGDAEVFNLIDYDIIDFMVIFSENINNDNLINRLIERGIKHGKPVLSIGKKMKKCINFLFDYTDGIDKMTRHVIEKHGCHDIYFMAGPKNEPISDARIRTFEHVMKEYGLPYDPEKQLYHGDYWTVPAQKETVRILKSGHVPEAVVCANDIMAITVCSELKKAGYRVPEDVIVTGFDGTNEALANIPSISTSGCSMNEMTGQIMDVLEGLAQGKVSDKSIYYDHTAGFDIILGQSCGCAQSVLEKEEMVVKLFKEEQDKISQFYDGEFDFHNFYKEIIKVPHLREFPDIMKNIRLCDVAVVMNDESFYEREDPMEPAGKIGFYDFVNVVYKSDDRGKEKYPVMINRKEVVNDFNKIADRGVPVIFSSLSFNDKPVGYFVFYDEVKSVKYNQIKQAVTRLNEYIGCYWLIKNLQYKSYQIDHIARHDHLTDLYNRNGFYDAMSKLKDLYRTKYMAVAEIDMDGLKRINDTLGHEAGDKAISALARAVNRVRLPYKICGRFGGDEFVILAAVDDESEACRISADIHRSLETFNETHSIEAEVNASVGVSVSLSSEFDFEYAVRQADEKMYIEKLTHKGRRADTE